MRDIKFRAWDKEAQQMLTVRDINFCGEELDTYEMDGDWLSFEDVEVMQYTGLKDKNGKEIYEGDIVLYNRNIDDEVDNYKYEVVWDKDQYGLIELKFKCYLWDNHWDMTEVIGNIYENSELFGESYEN